jgi:hypothetical protein
MGHVNRPSRPNLTDRRRAGMAAVAADNLKECLPAHSMRQA